MTAANAPLWAQVVLLVMVGVVAGLVALLVLGGHRGPIPTPRTPAPDETALCPGCGRQLYAPPGRDPLGWGCGICGWGTE